MSIGWYLQRLYTYLNKTFVVVPPGHQLNKAITEIFSLFSYQYYQLLAYMLYLSPLRMRVLLPLKQPSLTLSLSL